MSFVMLVNDFFWLRLTLHLVNIIQKHVHLLWLKRLLENFWIFGIFCQNIFLQTLRILDIIWNLGLQNFENFGKKLIVLILKLHDFACHIHWPDSTVSALCFLLSCAKISHNTY